MQENGSGVIVKVVNPTDDAATLLLVVVQAQVIKVVAAALYELLVFSESAAGYYLD